LASFPPWFNQLSISLRHWPIVEWVPSVAVLFLVVDRSSLSQLLSLRNFLKIVLCLELSLELSLLLRWLEQSSHFFHAATIMGLSRADLSFLFSSLLLLDVVHQVLSLPEAYLRFLVS
jgi:hypothetical protein